MYRHIFQQARRVAVFLLGIDAHSYVFTARIIHSELLHFEFLPTLFGYYFNTMFVKYLRIICLLTVVVASLSRGMRVHSGPVH
jgi:hypothetical protein